ncbi:MAG: hypothetical protein ABIR08_05285 [Sphingomonas sp.]
MRFTPIFAAILAFAGIASAAPASAATALTKPVAVGVSTIQPASGTAADQYRDRRGWRGDRGWRRGYYRRGYAYRPYRNLRRGRVVCRYRFGARRCYRVY